MKYFVVYMAHPLPDQLFVFNTYADAEDYYSSMYLPGATSISFWLDEWNDKHRALFKKYNVEPQHLIDYIQFGGQRYLHLCQPNRKEQLLVFRSIEDLDAYSKLMSDESIDQSTIGAWNQYSQLMFLKRRLIPQYMSSHKSRQVAETLSPNAAPMPPLHHEHLALD